MTTGIRFTVFGALALTALTLRPSVSAAGTDATKPNDLAKQKQTISDIRNVGTAMWVWYKDEVAAKRSDKTHKKAEAEAQVTSADISAVPVISRQELAKVLVPRYIASIPEKDGWGNPYEFHLNTTDPNAVRVMGLRSTGKDGQFAGNVYEVGPFAPEDVQQDIAWVDGYFVRWPQAGQQGGAN
jgi:hypothetical protein